MSAPDSYFHKRKAELVGPTLRKPPRDSRAAIEAHQKRVENDRRERERITAARRLERFLTKQGGVNEGS